MGGIINYFHGEGGIVSAVHRSPEKAETILHLEENSHRNLARDYGTDIGIDPAIQVGDRAVYWRLDGTCGIWVRQGQPTNELESCIQRVIGHRAFMEEWAKLQPERVPMTSPHIRPFSSDRWLKGSLSDEPLTRASIFLSYSHQNVLLAREIYRDLASDAGLDVWFDMSRPGEAPGHEAHVEEWLRSAVYETQGYLLLLSSAAVTSDWVGKEIAWAAERSRANPNFTPIVLKTDESPIPASLQSRAVIISVDGLWSAKGLQEELYSAIFCREGRLAWLKSGPFLGPTGVQEAPLTFSDFRSQAGEVTSLRWNGHRWRLRYITDKQEQRAEGSGTWEAVDPSVKPGDHIGFFVCRWRRGMHIDAGVQLWMRSDALTHTPDAVLDAYYSRIGRSTAPRVKNAAYELKGEDAYGRKVCQMMLETTTGRMSYQEYAMVYYNSDVSDPKSLLEEVLAQAARA